MGNADMAGSWRQWSREELEYQYSPSRWSKRLSRDEIVDAHLEHFIEKSNAAHASLDCERGISYGPTEKQKLDIFGGKELPKNAPILVYIHGGYWQYLGREVSAYMAHPMVSHGVVTVAVGYELADKASMEEIISQVRHAVVYILKYAKSRGSRGVYICGHSAGGHLTGMVLATDWSGMFPDVDIKLIQGAVPVSGVYDVRPIVNTYINDPLHLTEESAWEASPDNKIQEICDNCRKQQIKVLVVVGGDESPEFKRQSDHFHQNLILGGVHSEYIEMENHDHFDIVEKLSDENYVFTKKLLDLMRV